MRIIRKRWLWWYYTDCNCSKFNFPLFNSDCLKFLFKKGYAILSIKRSLTNFSSALFSNHYQKICYHHDRLIEKNFIMYLFDIFWGSQFHCKRSKAVSISGLFTGLQFQCWPFQWRARVRWGRERWERSPGTRLATSVGTRRRRRRPPWTTRRRTAAGSTSWATGPGWRDQWQGCRSGCGLRAAPGACWLSGRLTESRCWSCGNRG